MADRFLNIHLDEDSVQLSTRLRSRSTALTSALADKMLSLMLALQEKAQAGVSSSHVKESIRDPSVEIQSGRIEGALDWGGVEVSYKGGQTYDLAQIFEKGAKPHPINPLTEEGTREHKAGAKRRFGKSVLRWEEGGKAVFRPYVFHPGIEATNFMANAIKDMRETFRDQLMGVTYDALE